MRTKIYRASLRAFCIADSIKFPEAEYSFGIGTATKIPLFMPRFMFESAGPEAENITKQKKRCIIENEETPCLLIEHNLQANQLDMVPRIFGQNLPVNKFKR